MTTMGLFLLSGGRSGGMHWVDLGKQAALTLGVSVGGALPAIPFGALLVAAHSCRSLGGSRLQSCARYG